MLLLIRSIRPSTLLPSNSRSAAAPRQISVLLTPTSSVAVIIAVTLLKNKNRFFIHLCAPHCCFVAILSDWQQGLYTTFLSFTRPPVHATFQTPFSHLYRAFSLSYQNTLRIRRPLIITSSELPDMPHRHFHHRRQHEDHDGGSNAQSPADIAKQVGQSVQSGVATIVSVQFTTLSKTFSGPAIYTTISPPPIQSSKAKETTSQLESSLAGPATGTPSSNAIPTSITALESSTPAIVLSSGSISAQTDSSPSSVTTDSANIDSTSVLNSVSVTSSTGARVNASPTINGSPASTQVTAAPAAQPSSKDPTGGAKTDIAIGVILAFVALLALLAFCYRRRKNQQREAYSRAEDEKNPFDDNAATLAPVHGPTPAPAPTPASTPPQVSLRPASQFHPEFAGQRGDGNAVALAEAAVTTPNRGFGKAQNLGVQPNPFDDTSNPAHGGLGKRDISAIVQQEIPAPLRIRTPTPEPGVQAGLVVGAASATIAQRHNAPKPLDIKRSNSPTPSRLTEGAAPSPAATEFSMSSVSPASMTNGAPPLTNVHRVQLDFKPSMEDELELRAGQLVRLLHEYDDGWVSFSTPPLSYIVPLILISQALCIRLDRSQQGVAPRTCLSTRPVKPRSKPQPHGPATGPRGPPFLGSLSSSSGSSSPASPLAPRSMSPAPKRVQQRSMSPGPYGGGPQQKSTSPPRGKRRSNSVSDLREGKNSPPGPNPINPNARAATDGSQRMVIPLQAAVAPARKPVPAQTT